MVNEPIDYYPHDSMFKTSMMVKEIAEEFFDEFLPADIKQLIDLSTLKIEKDSFIDNTIGNGFVDMIFSVKMEDNIGYINLLVEHQSTVDKFMPVRIHKYKSLIYESHRKQYPNSTYIPIVIPIVYYTGEQKCEMPRTVSELTINPELDKKITTEGAIIKYLCDIPENQILTKKWLSVMMLLMKQPQTENIEIQINKISVTLTDISEKNYLYLQHCLSYIINVWDYDNPEKIVNVFQSIVSSEEKRKDIMNIATRLVNKGVEQGIERGIEQGFIQGKLENQFQTAKAMIDAGQDINFISQITGLSIDQIKSLYS